MLFLLKLVLVPGLIACVTLAARRWGHHVGGLLTGLPLIAGPTLCFYAVEQGPSFAATAARGTLLGLVAVTVFVLVYAWMCTRSTWWFSLLVGWTAFAGATTALYYSRIGVVPGFALVVVASVIALWLLPSVRSSRPKIPNLAWDLPLRMLAAASVVVTLTAAADWLGPALSGLLAVFPIATAIVATFTQAQSGPALVIVYFRGFLLAEGSFALFCVVLATTLGSVSLGMAIVLALVAQLSLQGTILWLMTMWPRGVTGGTN